MTIHQLNTLTEDELAMALYIVNNISPPKIPPGPFEARHLTWFKHNALIHKFLESFPKIKPEGHAIFSSLMEKLGAKVEIKLVSQVSETPITGSI